MMEQKYMSGIGNWLRAEILYKSRISPFRKLSELSDVDIQNLFRDSKHTIMDGFSLNGLTIQDYKDLNGNIGKYECLCYGRNTDNFGNKINNQTQDRTDRRYHWVPELQI